ncbi:ABC transporter permease [Angustibacter aerolatus]
MSTATTARPRTDLVPPSTDGFVHVLRAEWLKLWSVRSTAWTLLATFVVTVGISMLAVWGTMQGVQDGQDVGPFDATSLTLAGLGFGQLAIAVLGAMVISTEYSTGGIRSTLTATPHRLRLLGAKALAFVVVSFVLGLVSCFAAYFIGRLFLLDQFHTDLGDPGVLRAVVGGALYLVGSGMFGFALGVLLRNTPAAITIAVALLLVVSPLTGLLPGDWGDAIQIRFVSNAGQQITNAQPLPDQLSPWAGYAWFTGEWLLLLAVGAGLMRRRDA